MVAADRNPQSSSRRRQSKEEEESEQHNNKKSKPLLNAIGLILIFLTGFQVKRLDAYFSLLVSAVDLTPYFSQTMETTSVTNQMSSSSFQLAFDQSYGFFDDVSETDWKLYQDWARVQGNHRYAFDPKRQYSGRPALWYYNNYYPIFNCPHAKRIAGNGDGPKWVCDPHRLKRQVERRQQQQQQRNNNNETCLVYSIGSNGNYEFEDGMVWYHQGPLCEIHIFDYSQNYDRPENAAKNMYFHQLGLQGSQQNRGPQFASFPEIVKRLGHDGRTIDILKIDCEGCEWDTYPDWITHHYDIRQILVETHRLPTNVTLGFDFFDSFQRHDFMMFGKEANGFGGGEFYEFSYIKLHPDFLHPPQTNTTATTTTVTATN